MSLAAHDLAEEFPAAAADIARLRLEDPVFARLADRYDAVDQEVLRIESGLDAASDQRWEELKKQRLHLKDQIFAALRVRAMP